ncbi:ParA family protein [Leptospira dzoumogneensis]|uniref:Formate--tetrahydrofolate ligase n=1 Tax=Leptospira dzoumogneensis TaxID=2484904 RepID=A0A4Z1AKI5_9LEPT|nr:AAA family ATPase [Leptospira dzoumogneensis]TGN00215.1 formate--tetrahydrofolate ligase [Leptospira dzoumogneensis]
MKARVLSVEEVLSEYVLSSEDEFLEKAEKWSLPKDNKGKYKTEVLDKYFSKKTKHSYESVIIAVSNQKGGEGKTTVSICLAEALAKAGKKVLLLDWDAQANITQLYVGQADKSVFHSLGYKEESKVDISEIIVNLAPGLDLVPSSIHLANFTTPYERDDFDLLKEALLPIRSSYEYIIIDCPPSLGLILENALIAADLVLVPIQTRAFSVQGLKDLHGTIEKIRKKANPGLGLLGAVLNQYEDSRALSGLAETVRKYFPVFDSVVYRREAIPQSQAKRKLLSEYDPKAMQMFSTLAEEVMRRANGKKI